ncbi:MAG: hypothetical protein JRG83_04510 [Deltaproteobacteria bacterium]|nr:hypothetical protein [Deltaproteobacteria bacterium]
MRPLRLLLLVAAPFLLGPGCIPNTVHEVDFGDYVLRYRELHSQPASPTGYYHDLSATLERVGGSAAVPVAVVAHSVDPGTQVVAGQLGFAAPMPGPVPTSSAFRVRQGAAFDPAGLDFTLTPVTMPALLASAPSAGETVAPSAWPVLDFAAGVSPAALLSFALDCAGPISLAAHLVSTERVALNPTGDLPTSANCSLSWTGPGGTESVAFQVAAAGAPATIVYDRSDNGMFPPFPDDTLQVEDATTATGKRNAVPPPTSRPADVVNLAQGLLIGTNRLDGWSPIAAHVILLSEAPDVSSLPQTPEESLDPLASIGLFDVDPASPSYGERHPFELSYRANSLPGDPGPTHQLVLYPSRPLEPEGRYALAITRRALAAGLRPFGADGYFVDALGAPGGSEHPLLPVTRSLLDEILPVLAEDISPPLPSDDLALALSISVRSVDTVPDDVLAMRALVDALPAPTYVIDSNDAGTGDVERVVRGRWFTPNWLVGPVLQRDAAGVPMQNGTREVPFVMTLPAAALDSPVPILMYQHGNPGSSNEVVGAGGRVAGAGFAVIGFTDFLNDTFADTVEQGLAIFGVILINREMPEYYTETYGNQLAFLKLIESLSTLDLLPDGAPDGVPDVDPTLPITYEGISYGGVHGGALMPYAPEIRAAALVAGGGNFGERLFLQEVTDPLGTGGFLLTTLPGAVPNIEIRDIWVGLQYFQTLYDNQDPNIHALFTYGPRRFPVAGTMRKASILIIEGIDDSFSPNNSTRSEAWSTGPIPQLPPIAEPATVLEQVNSPINVANIDAETTAGLVQYVPWLNALPASPGCLGSRVEGHYCAQGAPEAIDQRVAFYRTAVDDGVPTIFDPFFDGDGDGRPDAQEVREGTDPDVSD